MIPGVSHRENWTFVIIVVKGLGHTILLSDSVTYKVIVKLADIAQN